MGFPAVFHYLTGGWVFFFFPIYGNADWKGVIRFKKFNLVQSFLLLWIKVNFVTVRLLCLVNSVLRGQCEFGEGVLWVQRDGRAGAWGTIGKAHSGLVFPLLIVTSTYASLSM